MTEKSPLESFTLLQPIISPILRREFLNEIFDTDLETVAVQSVDDGYRSFFSRYSTLCTLGANRSRGIEQITHWQLVKVIELLKGDEQRNDLLSKVKELLDRTDGEDFANALIDVAASTWLMLSIGVFPGDISYDEHLAWEKDRLFHNPYFSRQKRPREAVKLPQTFTAAHLEKIGGIEVRWTDNLADHLLLRDDDTKVMLFHQVSILYLHKQSKNTLLPGDFADETIRTISLLLPPVLGAPNPWFQRELRRYSLDACAGTCDRLNSSQRQIDQFAYWADRLILLKRTFDEAEPRTVAQLWWDDRRKTQWFTFWVAVLVFVMTVFFGVVQSVAGIVQAWAAVKVL